MIFAAPHSECGDLSQLLNAVIWRQLLEQFDRLGV
jgi:hypothetical protein